MNPECRKKYELNDFKKNNLLRVWIKINQNLVKEIYEWTTSRSNT